MVLPFKKFRMNGTRNKTSLDSLEIRNIITPYIKEKPEEIIVQYKIQLKKFKFGLICIYGIKFPTIMIDIKNDI